MKIFVAAFMFVLTTQAMGQNHSDMLSVIHNRTSIREYTTDKIDEQEIEILLRAAMAAPSSRNVQPWRFFVVEDQRLLKALSEQLPTAGMVGHAPLAIVVCADTTSGNPTEEQRPNWIMDCSAATQNLLLAAHAQGLGAVWTGVFPYQERIRVVSQVLELPAHMVPLSLIPIGHPLKESKPKDKWDPQKVFWKKQAQN